MSEEVFKALLIGDQHFADVTPASRTDNYLEEISSLLDYCLHYATLKGIRNVILLGDLFHRKRPSLNSHGLVAKLIDTFLEFKASYKEAHGYEPRVLTLVGNHDIQFTIDHVNRQPIHVLTKAGALEILDHPIQCEANVELNGHPYSEETETDPASYHLEVLNETALKLWCFHSTLLPDGHTFFGHWVNFHQVADIKANIVACGHYHPGYEPAVQEAHGKYWINPGAISRGTADEHNLNRDVKVVGVLVKWDGSKHSVFFRDIPLPAKPAAEIFKVEAIRSEKERRSEVEEFVATINSTVAEGTELSSVEQLKALLLKLTSDPGAISRASVYLDEAAEDLGA